MPVLLASLCPGTVCLGTQSILPLEWSQMAKVLHFTYYCNVMDSTETEKGYIGVGRGGGGVGGGGQGGQGPPVN